MCLCHAYVCEKRIGSDVCLLSTWQCVCAHVFCACMYVSVCVHAHTCMTLRVFGKFELRACVYLSIKNAFFNGLESKVCVCVSV